jgi:hypothetical protein
MAQDGKQLEALVAFVEQTLLPQGFTVSTNQRVFNDDGVQIAEFDVEVRGKVGSTEIAWLIECRDRPADGPAPGSWIEQLVGRRTRFGFNKVTAVSTTGFAVGASQFASQQRIELRDVRALSPDAFDWLQIRSLRQITRMTNLVQANLRPHRESRRVTRALSRHLSEHSGDAVLLRSVKTGENTTAVAAFNSAVAHVGNLFDGLQPNGPAKDIDLQVEYSGEDDYFVVNTRIGDVRIAAIQFLGNLQIEERRIPLVGVSEYKQAASGDPIPQVVSFAPQNLAGVRFSLEMHRIPESGLTHVIMRKLKDEPPEP